MVLDRRAFLSSSLASMAVLWRADLVGADDAPLDRPENLFLTWQRDPTTTMSVQWIGKSTDSSVHFRRHGDDAAPWQTVASASRPYPLSDLQAYRAELTGLDPGGEYQFRVGGNGQPLRFRTMPAKANSTIPFISGGDCGVDLHAINNNMLAAKQDPMFVVIGGDLGYDNGIAADTSIRFVRHYSKHMIDSQGRLIPLITCIGNHEVAGGYGKPREAAPFFFAMFDGLFKDTSYNVLDFGDYLSIVLLDTGHISQIAGEQTDWLNTTLADRADRPHVFVFNHVPAYPSYRPYREDGTGTGGDNRKHWSPLFEKHNVDLVLEHHDHTFKRTKPMLGGQVDERRGVIYLGDGSWGRLRPVTEPEKRPYLATYSSAYHLSLHRIEGAERFHLAIEESGKIIDICRTTKRPQSKVVS